MKIWLDDWREPPVPGYLWAHSVKEARALILEAEIRGEEVLAVDVDYELGEYELDGGKGMRLLEWMAARGTFYPAEVHSTHDYGRPMMEKFIADNWPA